MSNSVTPLTKRDPHAEVAARVFGVPVESVTEEQRRYAKSCSFMHIYHGDPSTLPKPKGGQ